MNRDSSTPRAQAAQATADSDLDVLPRTPRKPRRAKADRGLPPDGEILKLAKAYLERQRRHWPDLAKGGRLPDPTSAVLASMCDDFKERHRFAKIEPSMLGALQGIGQKLGGQYSRFSCENSDPKSIIDQMTNALDKAKDEKRFVPWAFVFADYSVSGLDASRQGYTSYKKVLSDPHVGIETTYIDDFTRASRDELEWWKLATQSRRLKKRLIGASDGFNLNDPDWDTKITIYGLISRLFIKSLRQKVVRGMRGTHRVRGSLGRPPFGYALRLKRDEGGHIALAPDGQSKKELAIDPVNAPHVRRAYEMYILKKMTPYAIVRLFNKERVDNWDGWTDQGMRKILVNPANYGLFIWNRTHREYDWEQEKWVIVSNPWREWERYHDPKLAIVPKSWVRQARRELRRKRRRIAEKLPVRNAQSRRTASHLFSDTLMCAYCQQPIRLYRSSGPTKDLYCPNGPEQRHGCRLSTSKAVSIVEEGLLAFLRDSVFTEAAVRDLVKRANAYLAEDAVRPRADLRPKKARAARLEASITKLVLLIERADESDRSLVDGYDRRIKQLQKELNDLRDEIRDEERRNAPSPAPLDVNRVQTYLADLRAVLDLEPSASAERLRAVTGPIAITQQTIPGRKRGARWIATFTPNLIALLAKIGVDKEYPDSITLEFLCNRIWINHKRVDVVLAHEPKYERLARNAEFLSYVRNRKNAHAISAMMQLPYELVVNALDFLRHGIRPSTKPPGRPRPKGTPKRELLTAKWGADVARLKDDEGMTYPAIAELLGLTKGTVARAYWSQHVDQLRAAAQKGEKARPAKYSRIGLKKLALIREAAANGITAAIIARRFGVGASTVYRTLRQG